MEPTKEEIEQCIKWYKHTLDRLRKRSAGKVEGMPLSQGDYEIYLRLADEDLKKHGLDPNELPKENDSEAKA